MVTWKWLIEMMENHGPMGRCREGLSLGNWKVSGFPKVLVPAYSVLKKEQLQLAQASFRYTRGSDPRTWCIWRMHLCLGQKYMNSLALGTWETQGPYADCCFAEQKGQLRSDMVGWHTKSSWNWMSSFQALKIPGAPNHVPTWLSCLWPLHKMLWFVQRASEDLWFNALHVFEGWLNATRMHHLRTDFWQCPSIQPLTGRAICSTKVPGFALVTAGQWQLQYFIPELNSEIDTKTPHILACQCSHRFPPKLFFNFLYVL